MEALDVLAEMTLHGKSNKEEIIDEIQKITNLGIDGDISFTESLERRIKLLKAHKDDLEGLVKELRQKISKSIESNKEFFEKFSDDIYVIFMWVQGVHRPNSTGIQYTFGKGVCQHLRV